MFVPEFLATSTQLGWTCWSLSRVCQETR